MFKRIIYFTLFFLTIYGLYSFYVSNLEIQTKTTPTVIVGIIMLISTIIWRMEDMAPTFLFPFRSLTFKRIHLKGIGYFWCKYYDDCGYVEVYEQKYLMLSYKFRVIYNGDIEQMKREISDELMDQYSYEKKEIKVLNSFSSWDGKGDIKVEVNNLLDKSNRKIKKENV